MKQILFSRSFVVLIVAVGFIFSLNYLADINYLTKVQADMTAQTVPFSQDWNNTDLINTNDDWSGVSGIKGFRGDNLATADDADPRTILSDGSQTPEDIIANQNNPSTNTSGGVAEFDSPTPNPLTGGFNPTVALQGSGTADVPHLVIFLDTTGQNNIRVQYKARDIDDQTGNDAIQQINTQFRVGGTGNYINIPDGYIADATTDGQNDVTPVDVVLPAAANNKSIVEVRIMTTNAPGSDEWIGIDDILITAIANPAPSTANVDFNGDGRSDFVITREQNGVSGKTQLRWYVSENGSENISVSDFGLATDSRIPSDYDGDGKTDIAVWRPDNGHGAAFYILKSSDMTVHIDEFGLPGDDPKVVGDYDGDGRDDVAVYRQNAGGQNFFYYRGSNNNPLGDITFVPWGAGEFVRPNKGDYDGDGKHDFCIFDQAGQFILLRSSDSAIEYVNWGIGSEALVPGDADNDGKDDFIIVRNENGNRNWYILERDGGGTGVNPVIFGLPDDRLTPGDYDGDGSVDIAIWRPSEGRFYIRNSSDNSLSYVNWGAVGDDPEANWKVHNAGVN